MLFKTLSLAAIASAVSAQNLTSVLSGNPDLSNLTALITGIPTLAASLSNATNITILAPNNDAISAFLSSNDGLANANNSAFISALLQYHVLPGTIAASAITDTPAFLPTSLDEASGLANVTGGQVVEAVTSGQDVLIYSGLVQNSTVVTPDVQFTGGVLHVIDSILSIPASISDTASFAGLTSLVGAVTQAQLADAIDFTPDLTVFAPTNEAFEAIGSAVGNLTMQDLAGILEYHVINGTVAYSSTLQNGMTVPSLAGPDLTITIDNGTVFVNSARVIIPDVLVANGVVHVIDQVLNPNATSATPVPSATSQTAAFSGASSITEAPFTSGITSGATPTPTAGPSGSAAPSGGETPTASGAVGASTAGAFAPMRTGAVGVAALFAGAGMVLNF